MTCMCQSSTSWPEMRGWTGCASSSAFSALTASMSRPAEPCSKTSRSRLAPRRSIATSRSVASWACQLSGPKNARSLSSVSTWALTRSTAVRAYSSKFTRQR